MTTLSVRDFCKLTVNLCKGKGKGEVGGLWNLYNPLSLVSKLFSLVIFTPAIPLSLSEATQTVRIPTVNEIVQDQVFYVKLCDD